MKVGDYVRTKSGYIYKVKDTKDDIILDNDYPLFSIIRLQGEVKSSPNIIDLIEVGDYVNGYCVLKEHYTYMGEHFIGLDTLNSWEWGIGNMPTKYIKSIVTREQFETMQYEVK